MQQFTTQRPTFANDDLFGKLQADGVTVNANPPSQGTPLWEELLLWFGPALLFGGLLYWYMRNSSGALGGLGGLGMGKSKARRYDPSTAKRITFADVAGIDDVKDEVMEIVDFMRDPGKYTRLGAQIPHGVLLAGQPGTGKTLLARAVAGEAQVPFFSTSASEFVEMIVGVGASRVRDLFDQAKPPPRSSSSTSWTPSAGPAAQTRQAAMTSRSTPSTTSSPRWTGSPATRPSWCWPPPTGPTCWTRR